MKFFASPWSPPTWMKYPKAYNCGTLVWSEEQFAQFIVKYLGPMFEANNIDTKIWLGTLNCPETDERTPYTRYNNYANLVLHDEEAYYYIEGVSYQWAGKYAVQVTHKCFPEKKLIHGNILDRRKNAEAQEKEQGQADSNIWSVNRTYADYGVHAAAEL